MEVVGVGREIIWKYNAYNILSQDDADTVTEGTHGGGGQYTDADPGPQDPVFWLQ